MASFGRDDFYLKEKTGQKCVAVIYFGGVKSDETRAASSDKSRQPICVEGLLFQHIPLKRMVQIASGIVEIDVKISMGMCVGEVECQTDKTDLVNVDVSRAGTWCVVLCWCV